MQRYTKKQIAQLHHIAGKIEKILKAHNGVDIGNYKIGRRCVQFTSAPNARVDREKGEQGDGYIYTPVDKLQINLNVSLWYNELAAQSKPTSIEEVEALWVEAFKRDARGMKIEPPAAAISAMQIAAVAVPDKAPDKRRTPAERTGEDDIEISFQPIEENRQPQKRQRHSAVAA